MVAALVLLGVLTKFNETTAVRCCGVSLFRLTAPILVVAMLISGGIFLVHDYVLPQANRKAELLKDAYREDLSRSIAENDIPGLVTLSHWCHVTDTFEVRDEDALNSLSEHHIWTDDYAQKRLHWRPKQPLTVALLRVFELQQPQALPVLDEYVGCKSWVELGQDLPLGYMNPALSDEEYESRAEVIR